MSYLKTILFITLLFSGLNIFSQRISFGEYNTRVFYICPEEPIASIGDNDIIPLGSGTNKDNISESDLISKSNSFVDCDSSSLSNPVVKLDTSVSVGSLIQLHASLGSDYSWQPEDGLYCMECQECLDCQNPKLNVYESIPYEVTYIDTNNCPQKERFIFNVVYCDEVIPYSDMLKLDTIVAPGSSITLSPSEAESYSWSPKEGLSCNNCSDPNVIVNNDIEYKVTLTINSCSWTERFNLEIDCDTSSLVNPIIKLDTVVNAESVIELEASKGSDYLWNPNTDLRCMDDQYCQKVEVTIFESINYDVTFKDNNNCLSKEKFNIKVQDCNELDTLMLDTAVVIGSSIKLLPTEAKLYSWSPIEDLSCLNCKNPDATIDREIEYIVTLTDNNNCSWTERFKFTINDSDTVAVIPNVFTPNNDGFNDKFVIPDKLKGSILEVYDNKGKLVFESHDYNNDWEGLDLEGKKLPTNNTYWYVLQTSESKMYKGWIFIK